MNKLRFKSLIGVCTGLVLLLYSFPAQAETIDLYVYSLNQQQNCPKKVTLQEQSQPYREGSFAKDGSANLSAYATNFSVSTSNDFSVTWVGTLKPNFARCVASAGISKVDGKDYEGQINHLRMHFLKGKAYLILDLAGGRDPNNYPLVVIKKGVKNGSPVWTWGGSD